MSAAKVGTIAAVVVVGGLALYIASAGVRGAANTAARGSVNAVWGAMEGFIHGASDVVGIPTPERAACELAKAEGRTWDASWACPAGEFMQWIFTR